MFSQTMTSINTECCWGADIMKDIYFDENYGRLYEKAENGISVVYKCQTGNGEIINQFIKREIPADVNGEIYYDIVTPYGYGGPYIASSADRKELLKDYEKQFADFCHANNIVAEFVRFHPIYKNYEDFRDIYDASFNRYTLATDIKDFDNPVQSEFSKHTRKTIRSVLNKGVTFRMVEDPTREDVEEFKRIYYLNMERKEADEYYFFDDSYFEQIRTLYKGRFVIAQALYQGKVIAAGLYFTTANNVHAHLSGTDTEYLYLSPAYILKYGTALWAKEKGYDYIHYGGGTSTAPDNPLYLFKQKFAQNTRFEFWTGRKIWNEKVYDQLCSMAGVSPDEEYFPAYRKVMK